MKIQILQYIVKNFVGVNMQIYYFLCDNLYYLTLEMQVPFWVGLAGVDRNYPWEIWAWGWSSCDYHFYLLCSSGYWRLCEVLGKCCFRCMILSLLKPSIWLNWTCISTRPVYYPVVQLKVRYLMSNFWHCLHSSLSRYEYMV